MLCIPDAEDARVWAEAHVKSKTGVEFFLTLARHTRDEIFKSQEASAQRIGRLANKRYLINVRASKQDIPLSALRSFCYWMGSIYGLEFKESVMRYCVVLKNTPGKLTD